MCTKERESACRSAREQHSIFTRRSFFVCVLLHTVKKISKNRRVRGSIDAHASKEGVFLSVCSQFSVHRCMCLFHSHIQPTPAAPSPQPFHSFNTTLNCPDSISISCIVVAAVAVVHQTIFEIMNVKRKKGCPKMTSHNIFPLKSFLMSTYVLKFISCNHDDDNCDFVT